VPAFRRDRALGSRPRIRAARQAKSGNQSNDPAKAAQALLTIVEEKNPPTRLFLGEDALGLVDRKLDDMRAEVGRWEVLSRSTGFDAR
jgi:hypothetical protein